MPQLNLNNIEPELHVQLCEIAKEEGRSVEELVQAMIRNAVAAKQEPHLATRLANRFSLVGLADDEQIEEMKGQEVRSPSFDQ